ncbi:MAG: hypothetical protein K0R17_1132 [Rariglobus sp.]|nr:hypothetical protein [Rariglobus sp.]
MRYAHSSIIDDFEAGSSYANAEVEIITIHKKRLIENLLPPVSSMFSRDDQHLAAPQHKCSIDRPDRVSPFGG